MKKILSLMVMMMAMALTSCIEHHVVILLNKDGSGTITEETSFGGQAVAMMEQMAAMGGEAAGDPLGDMVDEAKAKEKAASMGEGVTLSKVEKIDEGGRKGGRVVYAFKDINKVKYQFGDAVSEMGDEMKPPGAEDEKAPEEVPMTFVYKDNVLKLANPGAGKDAAAGSDEEAGEELDETGLEMAKQMMGDMKMSIKLELPGGIAETNASHVDGNTITFMEMEMGKLLEDPEKFKAFSKAKPETPAAMQEALKGVEGVKIETKEEVNVTLK
ncbi:hypothetical protein ACFQY0_18110 [Haloferula chungangensis]|uniref:Lipoprotein n=1 Tax=Haloferula chungangensis TaxID=1048331 RepID=A0ABW2LBS1_9BACT